MINELADVQSTNIGQNTRIWQFVVVLKNAIIGAHCNINAQVFIENDVIIGDNVTVKSGVQIWDGIRLDNNVFVGPNATFTNDKSPRSKVYPEHFTKTIVEEFASIGANATILPGLTIGKYAMIGAGSVVIKDILPYQIVAGNPAKLIGFITSDGIKVSIDMKDSDGNNYIYENNELNKL